MMLKLSTALLVACLAFLSTPLFPSDTSSAAAQGEARSHVYFVRGFANVFSTGLDDMAARLSKDDVDVTVLPHLRIDTAYTAITSDNQAGKNHPVVLVGHSLGANAILRLAHRLRARNIPIAYMVTFAATDPDPVPSNVGKLTNYYFATDGWGKKVRKGKGFRGNLKNIDFSDSETIGHFNIDEQPELQEQVISNVKRFALAR